VSADKINPAHYKSSKSGVECIEVTRHLSFNLGNAVKYLWRCGQKDEVATEVGKAVWYLSDEIDRLANGTWVAPPNRTYWSRLFTQHILTVENEVILAALLAVRDAIFQHDIGALRDARQSLQSL
jgi:hypothetical protein